MTRNTKLAYASPCIEEEQNYGLRGMMCASVESGAIEEIEIEDLTFQKDQKGLAHMQINVLPL